MPRVLFQYQESRGFKKIVESISFSKLINFFSLFLLVLAIPLTVFYAHQQQDIRQNAQELSSALTKNVKLSITSHSPIFSVGQTKGFDILLDPKEHAVSFVKITLQHPYTHVATTSATPCFESICINKESFPMILEGPEYVPGYITFSASIGPDAKNAITKAIKVATVYLTARQATEPNKATINFLTLNNSTQILSISPQDSPSTNMLGEASPLEIIVTR